MKPDRRQLWLGLALAIAAIVLCETRCKGQEKSLAEEYSHTTVHFGGDSINWNNGNPYGFRVHAVYLKPGAYTITNYNADPLPDTAPIMHAINLTDKHVSEGVSVTLYMWSMMILMFWWLCSKINRIEKLLKEERE